MQPNGSITLNRTEGKAIRIVSMGHAMFAVTMVALGILGLMNGKFTPIWYGPPKSFPAREVLAYLCAIISLITGFGLLFQRTALISARALLASFVLWMLLFRVYYIFIATTETGTWWTLGESAVMIASALVLSVWFAGDANENRLNFLTGENGLRIARILYGLGMIPFGIAHFTYLKFTTPLVPSYLPWHLFWAYFTGCAFIAAGIAMISGVFARLAATLSAWQMGFFTILVWIPIIFAGKANDFQKGEFIDSITLTAAAWVVAESYRRISWFAVRKK
jgi:uncharacterized membrane protein